MVRCLYAALDAASDCHRREYYCITTVTYRHVRHSRHSHSCTSAAAFRRLFVVHINRMPSDLGLFKIPASDDGKPLQDQDVQVNGTRSVHTVAAPSKAENVWPRGLMDLGNSCLFRLVKWAVHANIHLVTALCFRRGPARDRCPSRVLDILYSSADLPYI